MAAMPKGAIKGPRIVINQADLPLGKPLCLLSSNEQRTCSTLRQELRPTHPLLRDWQSLAIKGVSLANNWPSASPRGRGEGPEQGCHSPSQVQGEKAGGAPGSPAPWREGERGSRGLCCQESGML